MHTCEAWKNVEVQEKVVGGGVGKQEGGVQSVLKVLEATFSISQFNDGILRGSSFQDVACRFSMFLSYNFS